MSNQALILSHLSVVATLGGPHVLLFKSRDLLKPVRNIWHKYRSKKYLNTGGFLPFLMLGILQLPYEEP